MHTRPHVLLTAEGGLCGERTEISAGSEAALSAGSLSSLRGRVTAFRGAIIQMRHDMGTGTGVRGSIEGLVFKHMNNCLPLMQCVQA